MRPVDVSLMAADLKFTASAGLGERASGRTDFLMRKLI